MSTTTSTESGAPAADTPAEEKTTGTAECRRQHQSMHLTVGEALVMAAALAVAVWVVSVITYMGWVNPISLSYPISLVVGVGMGLIWLTNPKRVNRQIFLTSGAIILLVLLIPQKLGDGIAFAQQLGIAGFLGWSLAIIAVVVAGVLAYRLLRKQRADEAKKDEETR